MTPLQWHLYVVDLEPRIGTKPGKQRPALAVQPSEFAEAGLKSTVIIPITTNIVEDAFPLRIRIPLGTTSLKAPSDLLIDQILAWDHSLFRRDLGEIPEELREKVKAALGEFLDLSTS